MLIDYNKFRSFFNLRDKVDYETFVKSLRVRRNQKIMNYTIDQFIDDRKDWRISKRQSFYENLYKICVQDREETLRKWYNAHIKIDNLYEHMHFKLDKNILDNDIISGMKYNKGRIVKNINFDKIFATKKYNDNDNMPILKSLDEMLNDFVINSNLIIPNGFRKIIECNLLDIFAIMRGTRHRASIFNPYTYGWLLQNYFEGTKIIAGTAGWNSYQIGFHQTNWSEFTCIDVIESVIENSRKISDYYENENKLFKDNKKVNAYCYPSEKINLEEKNYYDLCLFSPPYFNLEVYETNNTNQSIKSYPKYEDWLECYWNATVINLSKSIKPGGTFAFIISNYKNIFGSADNETYDKLTISQDMLKIASRHLKFKKTQNIAWGTFKILNGKMASGNIEDMHVLTK